MRELGIPRGWRKCDKRDEGNRKKRGREARKKGQGKERAERNCHEPSLGPGLSNLGLTQSWSVLVTETYRCPASAHNKQLLFVSLTSRITLNVSVRTPTVFVLKFLSVIQYRSYRADETVAYLVCGWRVWGKEMVPWWWCHDESFLYWRNEVSDIMPWFKTCWCCPSVSERWYYCKYKMGERGKGHYIFCSKRSVKILYLFYRFIRKNNISFFFYIFLVSRC